MDNKHWSERVRSSATVRVGRHKVSTSRIGFARIMIISYVTALFLVPTNKRKSKFKKEN